MSKKVKIIFIASISLNIFVLGLILGHFSGRHRPPFWGGTGHHEMVQNLSKEKRTLFMQTMKKLKREDRQLRKQMHAARKETMESLTDPVFDPGLYQSRVKALHKLHGERVERLSQAVQELAVKLTREEREILAEHLKKAFERGGRGEKGKRPRRGPPPN